MYHTNVMCLSHGCGLQLYFIYLLEVIKLFVEKENKVFEELHDNGWIRDLAFFLDMTCHLNTPSTELQGGDKLII
jgi:hypothetical protein